MCFIEGRGKKSKIKSNKEQGSAPAPKPSMEKGPRLHINLDGTSGISFPSASVSKIPSYLWINSTPTGPPAAQQPSETPSASTTAQLKQQNESKTQTSLSTSISIQGNEIVKGAEELHCLASRLENASASSPRSPWQSRRSRSTDKFGGSDGSRLWREKELDRELLRDRECTREWERERDRQRGWDREILALTVLERERCYAEKIKEMKRERQMEKAIAGEVKNQILEASTSHIYGPLRHGYGHVPEIYSPANSARPWNVLSWGSAVDNEPVVLRKKTREIERESARTRRGSLLEMAIEMAMELGARMGNGNGNGTGGMRPKDREYIDGGGTHFHNHRHSHNQLHYNNPSSRGAEYEYGIRSSGDKEWERRKSSVGSMVSVVGAEYAKKILNEWARGETLLDGEMDREREREGGRGRNRERNKRREYGYGCSSGARPSTARRRGVVFDH